MRRPRAVYTDGVDDVDFARLNNCEANVKQLAFASRIRLRLLY